VQGEQRRFNASVAQATKQTAAKPGVASQIGMGLVGLGVSHKAKDIGGKAIESVADFDIAIRQQKVFMDLAKEDQEKLKAQALKIGQDTKFTNLDVVHAQTAAMQGMGAKMTPAQKAQAALGITQAASNFAQMMPGTDLTRSSELLRSYMTSFGKNLSDPVTAVAESVQAANLMLKAAKAGGMSAEDLEQYVKFAGAAAKAAGLTEETTLALAATARIGGLRGDEAGVFVRSMSNKLTNPTNPGLTALQAAGIKYSDYVGMPASLNVENFGGHMQRRLGKKLDAKARDQLAGIFQNKDILASRDEFTAAVTKAVAHLFEPKKDGSMRASDAKTIAKEAGSFHKMSAGSVDTMRLLMDIMGGKMTFAQASAFFTDKHGGKAMITQQQFEEMQAIIKKLHDAKNDPGFAERGAAEIQGGVGGEINRFKGSIETMYLKIGEANEGLIKFAATVGGAAVDSFSNASTEVRQFTTAIVAAGAAFAGWQGLKALMGGFGLTTSATALNGSAAALTAAATRLGFGATGGSIVGGAGASAGAAAGGAAAPGVLAAAAATGATVALSNIAAGNPLDIGLTPEQAKAKNDKRRDLERSHNPGGSSRAQDDALKVLLGGKGAAQRGPMGDTSALDGFVEKAGDAKQKLDGLNTTVKPSVDTSGLQQANALADSLVGKLQQIHSMGRGIAGSLGTLGQMQRRSFSYGGGEGE